MDHANPIHRLAAFAAACLLVLWTCGSFGAALFKVGWRLLYGTWPDTRIYGILPDFLPINLTFLPPDDVLAMLWRWFLGCDVLHVLLVAPPFLLLACLLPLRRRHGGVLPALRRTANHIGPRPRNALPTGRLRRA